MSHTRILIILANPFDKDTLRLGREARVMEECLRRSRRYDRFRTRTITAARPQDVQRALIDFNPHIVHFSGHGEGEHGILLENERGAKQYVPGKALATLFRTATALHGVILNGCLTDVPAREVARVVRFVVGLSGTIADELALSFARGFYDGLGEGMSIAEAFAEGRVALDMHDSLAPIPVLFGEDRGPDRKLPHEWAPPLPELKQAAPLTASLLVLLGLLVFVPESCDRSRNESFRGDCSPNIQVDDSGNIIYSAGLKDRRTLRGEPERLRKAHRLFWPRHDDRFRFDERAGGFCL